MISKKLLEASRQELLKKGKAGDAYKDQSKGKNRYERRKRSSIATTVRQYNRIDMNTLFKNDILNIGIEVKGETDTYIIKIRFENIIKELAAEIKLNNNKLEFKTILLALTRTFNKDDVYVSCSCPDWKFSQAFHATKDGYNSGVPELRPSNITNPKDSKGSGCKHIMLVLANVDWMMKVASVINNYIKYMQETFEDKYARFIHPKLYNKPYQKPTQIAIGEPSELETEKDIIDVSNILGRERGKFKKAKEVNNQRNVNVPKKQTQIKGQQSLADMINEPEVLQPSNPTLQSEIENEQD